MFDIARATDFLEDLIGQHDDRIDQARAFGLRTAALPKGLMPFAEAQRIVASFEKDTEQLSRFLDGLTAAGKAPLDMQADLDALKAKANKALQKFKDDKQKAQASLDNYEDILVGEHFQEAFEALRHALLDLDLADDVDMDFKTDLNLNANPAWAQGNVIITQGSTKVLTVFIGYRAEDDYYWGGATVAKTGKTYKSIVNKSGHTFLPRFIRELTEQIKALADSLSLGIFRSRKKVELKIQDPDTLLRALKPALEAKINEIRRLPAGTPIAWRTILQVADKGDEASGTIILNGYGWPKEKLTEEMADNHVATLEQLRKSLMGPFTVTTQNGQTWDVQASGPEWIYQDPGRYYSAFTASDMHTKWPLEWRTNIQSIPMDDIRQRAMSVGILGQAQGFGAQKKKWIDLIRTKMPQPQGLVIASGSLSFTMTRKMGPGKSAQRVATRYLTAGGNTFSNYIAIPDADRAFRRAQEEAGYERGHGYSGTIVEKPGYTIRKRDPMTRSQAHEFVNQDLDNNEKWGPAFAVPISEEKVLKKDTVTVTVDARDEADAKKRGALKIKATGRVPPQATILVDIKKVTHQPGPGSRTKTFEVVGERRSAITGAITGWLFYGWASS